MDPIAEWTKLEHWDKDGKPFLAEVHIITCCHLVRTVSQEACGIIAEVYSTRAPTSSRANPPSSLAVIPVSAARRRRCLRGKGAM